MSGAPSWNDESIKAAQEDTLQRGHLVRRASGLIQRAHSWHSSVVFGVTGPWGSGKSSLVAMIEEQLQADAPEWAVARFTPWASSDTSSLLAEFFAALESAVPVRESRVRDALRACATVATPAMKLIPFVGDAASEVMKLGQNALAKPKSWDQVFQTAAAQIRAARTPVLVVADDIDRLQTDELFTFLKVIRLLGRFPGVHYLLAYDEQTLLANLQSGGVGDLEQARLFMEKIVQYPLVIPRLLPLQIALRFDEGLTQVMADAGRPLKRSEPRLSTLLPVFESQLGTPRAIDRLLAQLRVTVPMHQIGEINDLDVILLAFVKIQFPVLWSTLPRWKNALTGQADWRQWIKSTQNEAPDWDRLLTTVPEGSRQDARDVLEDLFPAMARHALTRGRGPHINSFDYFDRYFAETVPEGDVPDAEISAALAEASQPGAAGGLLRVLLSSTYPRRIDVALSKLRFPYVSAVDRAEGGFSNLNLVRVVAGLISDLDDGQRSMFGRRDQGVHWLADLVSLLPRGTTTAEIAAGLAGCIDDSLRLWVIWEALERLSDRNPFPNLVERAQAEADAASASVLDHLRQRDGADPSSSRLFELRFVQRYGNAADLADKISQGIELEFKVEDVLARLVSINILIADPPVPHLGDFNDELYKTFASSLPGDPLTPELVINEYDVSWPNRRAAANRGLWQLRQQSSVAPDTEP